MSAILSWFQWSFTVAWWIGKSDSSRGSESDSESEVGISSVEAGDSLSAIARPEVARLWL